MRANVDKCDQINIKLARLTTNLSKPLPHSHILKLRENSTISKTFIAFHKNNLAHINYYTESICVYGFPHSSEHYGYTLYNNIIILQYIRHYRKKS